MTENTLLDRNATASEPADQVKTFLKLLDQADSVMVDDQLLMGWHMEADCGDPENEVVRFSWIDDESLEFSLVLTEASIAEGRWVGASFFCNDSEGDEVQISLHRHVALTPQHN